MGSTKPVGASTRSPCKTSSKNRCFWLPRQMSFKTTRRLPQSQCQTILTTDRPLEQKLSLPEVPGVSEAQCRGSRSANPKRLQPLFSEAKCLKCSVTKMFGVEKYIFGGEKLFVGKYPPETLSFCQKNSS